MRHRNAALTGRILPALFIGLLVTAQASRAAVITTKSGMQFEGKLGKVAGLAENPLSPNQPPAEVGVKLVVLLDDELRRTFISKYQVHAVRESEPLGDERIKIAQRVARTGHPISSVGQIIRMTPWDEWGRRIITMRMQGRGTMNVIQGITEITPRWTRVEGLLGANLYVWEQRIATSSIPRATLSKILMKQIDPKNPDSRLRIARLYIQGERYKDARTELEAAIRDFPELRELKQNVVTLRQHSAQQLIDEIELRHESGQHELVFQMLSSFPDEDVAGETLLKVRRMLERYREQTSRAEKVLKLIDQHMETVEDPELLGQIKLFRDELESELNINNLLRFADYLRLSDDEAMTGQQKLALAISGWVLGSGAAKENLAVALSLLEVRDLVVEYLRAPHQVDRDAILEKMRAHEGSAPVYVAKILKNIKPPLETPSQENGIAGMFEMSVPGLVGESNIEYVVQLPPNYDPYLRYPAVVSLHATGTTAKHQIDWWAGGYSEKLNMRLGQASRNGYIVIAPKWTKRHQTKYEFSAGEHAAVLLSLRDACRRFSVDTDRVYLSGHSVGGDAAWDIGISHPDLWAGVIPIVPRADKYIARYWGNAKNVPMYFVGGELDGDRMAHNALDLDRYLTKTGFDVTVVEFLGRGHEHFQDEIHRLFQWMELHERDFAPKEFKCSSMRAWDSFFWWVELDQLPANSLVEPHSWPPKGVVRPCVTTGSILSTNHLRLRTAAGRATIFLAPEFVDFDKRITITVNSRSRGNLDSAVPSAGVMLEDVRTRGDRQHPFWAKVELKTGRGR